MRVKQNENPDCAKEIKMYKYIHKKMVYIHTYLAKIHTHTYTQTQKHIYTHTYTHIMQTHARTYMSCIHGGLIHT
jgi:hypothetical protein